VFTNRARNLNEFQIIVLWKQIRNLNAQLFDNVFFRIDFRDFEYIITILFYLLVCDFEFVGSPSERATMV
jgi:hypothetical protein